MDYLRYNFSFLTADSVQGVGIAIVRTYSCNNVEYESRIHFGISLLISGHYATNIFLAKIIYTIGEKVNNSVEKIINSYSNERYTV